jgi:hypothetical protein
MGGASRWAGTHPTSRRGLTPVGMTMWKIGGLRGVYSLERSSAHGAPCFNYGFTVAERLKKGDSGHHWTHIWASSEIET